MNIVVTGATGLIGQHLVSLLAAAHDVFAIARQERPQRLPGNVDWITADLTTPGSISHLPPRADVVVHLAQSGHYRDFPTHALDVFDVNVASTARLLDWSVRAGVQHFILASSGGIHAAMRLSNYLASKRAAELLAESYTSSFRVLVLRFFFVYGRGQKPWMLVPRLVDSIRNGREVHIAGDHGPRLNPVHVDDAVRAIARGIDVRVDGTIDIAGPDIVSVREMCDAIAMHLGAEARFAVDTDRAPEDVIGDIGPMSAKLIAPVRRFSEAVADTLPAAEASFADAHATTSAPTAAHAERPQWPTHERWE